MLKLTDEDIENNAPRYRNMWTSLFVVLLTLGFVAAVFVFADYFAVDTRPPFPNPPHIIFLLVDDLGWNDVSFHGSAQIPTPNMDALASAGIILNNYYTHPKCSPSRGALLSGKYANRIGLQNDDLQPLEPAGLPADIQILPQYLKKLGYRNYMVGKWHLGYHDADYLPTHRGFENFFGNLNGHLDYYDYTVLADENNDNELSPVFGVDLWEDEQLAEAASYRGQYVTSLYTDKAIEIITAHNATEPLFLFVSLTACHLGNSYMPLQAPLNLVAQNKHISDPDRRKYAGMVTAVDEAVGQIFEVLNLKNMLTNSLFVVTTDNGGLASAGGGSSSNYPLRGMKNYVWEGGIRSNAIIWSPLFGLETPRTSTQLMHITDWLPTFYSVGGGNVDDLNDIDGIDMWSCLLDKDLPSPRKEILLHNDPVFSMGALRSGDMKLIFGSTLSSEDDWYGPSGEDTIAESIDEWVWSKDSAVKSILEERDWWLLTENDTWRQDAVVVCGINFLPETGKCEVDKGPCLYNITEDPCEYRNLASLYPEIVDTMMERFIEISNNTIQAVNKELDPRGDPRCLNFAFAPWMTHVSEISSCPWI